MVLRQSRLGERFLIEHLMGSGGTGSVYKGVDLVSSRPVAIKIQSGLHSSQEQLERFEQECHNLAALNHPAVVQYVAHGSSTDGSMYLVMEWLVGEDLSEQLRRGPLTVPESGEFLASAVRALAYIHQRGVMHLDIKPSNLFLRHFHLHEVTLIDFGLSRQVLLQSEYNSKIVDPAQLRCGTPYYVAPEVFDLNQVRTPAADVFSLGCVMFECLTGQALFHAEQSDRALINPALASRPKLQVLCPQMPSAWMELIERMLCPDPAGRPSNAVELLAEFRKLRLPDSAPSAKSPLTTLTSGEQLLQTMLLVPCPLAPDQEVHAAEAQSQRAALRQFLTERGSMLVHESASGLAWMTAQQAETTSADVLQSMLHLGLAVQQSFPELPIALVSQRTPDETVANVGSLLERAWLLLRTTGGTTPRAPVLDGLTMQLASARFHIEKCDAHSGWLRGTLDMEDSTRLLLGKPTQCVGREQELQLLEATMQECATQKLARAVLVLSPPGFGKSRLRHEFIRRLQSSIRAVTLLQGSADSMHVGSAYYPLGRALRRLCEIAETDTTAVKHSKLKERLSALLSTEAAQQYLPFLAELAGLPFPSAVDPRLSAARSNPTLMSTQVTRAWIEFLRAATERCPVLLVLEDMHWGDALTLGLISAALRELSGRPLMYLLLARPEFEELFPRSGLQRMMEIVRLGRLGRRAGQRLVRQVVGPSISDADVDRIVTRSDGSALFLEELIRAHAAGTLEEVPEVVLSVLHCRLLRFGIEDRRVLRAASIFGESFQFGGLCALLGKPASDVQLLDIVTRLVVAELLDWHTERVGTEPRLSFRHSLIREASYSLLTAEDRVRGHLLAAAFLEQDSEQPPALLAEHYMRGLDAARAVKYYTKAAEQALVQNDLGGALSYVAQGLSIGATDPARGHLCAINVVARFYRDEWSEALQNGQVALHLLPSGCRSWYQTAAQLLPILNFLQDPGMYEQLADAVMQAQPEPGARSTYIEAAANLVITRSLRGQREPGHRMLQIIEAQIPSLADHEAVDLGRIEFSAAVHAYMVHGNAWNTLQHALAGSQAAERAGDLRAYLFVKPFTALALADMGDVAEAEKILRDCLTLARERHQPLLVSHILVSLAATLLKRGSADCYDEAIFYSSQVVTQEGGNPLLLGQAHMALAAAHHQGNDLVKGLSQTALALGLLQSTPSHYVAALAQGLSCALDLGNHVESARLLQLGLERVGRTDSTGYGEIPFWLAVCKYGLVRRQHALWHQARTWLFQLMRRQAHSIPSKVLRRSFLRNSPSAVEYRQLALWRDR